MIRIVDMREATSSGSSGKDFAVWDTVRDRFIEVDGAQCFDGQKDFVEAISHELQKNKTVTVESDRVLRLLPPWAR